METKAEPAESIGHFLQKHAPFDRMEPGHLDFLTARLKPVRFADGEVVTDPAAGPAEWFYVLREGRIAGEAAPDEDGDPEIAPGECFPIGALVANRPVRETRRAVGAAVCLTMNRAAFDELRALSEVFAEHCSHRLSGLIQKSRREVQAKAAQSVGGDSSLDVRLSEKRLRDPVTATPGTTIRAVVEEMGARRIGSMVMVDPEGRPVGIFTLKDLMNRVVLKEKPLDGPIRDVMTPDPVTLPRTAFAFEAAMRMADAGIQHICVVEGGRLTGVLSERDLFSMQRIGLVNLTKSIARADSVGELKRLAGDVHLLVNQMIAQGVSVTQTTRIITLLNDHVVVRVIELVLAGRGGAPGIEFTWLAFGSEGRQEQTLKTDQDNGILFSTPAGMSADGAREALLPLAGEINDALDACGFPLCTGGIMARNPECCLTLEEWRSRFVRWIDQGTPEQLLKASIFFDFRPIHGPEAPARELRSWLLERVAGNSRFRKQMAMTALSNAPPLGMIRDFRLSGTGDEANTIDLKFNGVTPFVDAARILALASGVEATNTLERLRGAAQAGAIDANDAEAWADAYDFIRLLRMRRNEEQAAGGRKLSNRVDPSALNDLDRRILKEAFREAKRLQSKIALDYQI
jgi:CBS domain-containing protein